MKNSEKHQQSVVRHILLECFAKGNLSLYDEFVSKEIRVHCPMSWEEFHHCELIGRRDVKKIDLEYTQAFQFKKVDIGDLIIERNKVFARWKCEGIHKNHFFNIKAASHPFTLTGQTVYCFTDEGQIGEVWQSWDMLGLINQIGYEKPSFQIPIHMDSIEKLLEKAISLSKREKQCLKNLLYLKTAKETASSLKISHRTVEYYFENIKNKLNCFSKKELLICAGILNRFHLL